MITSVSVEQEVVAIVAEITGTEAKDIGLDSDLTADLEVDSIKAIEITVAIEKRFRVSVRDEDVPNIRTVRQAVEVVKKMIPGK